jgi:putative two-component system response regulator
MMSGKFNNVDVNRLATHSPVQFFSKPFDVNKLVMLTEQIVFNKSHQARKEYEHLISSIWALITALEARDKYTMGHSERVTAYASMVGRELGFNSQQMRTLEVSAALHDIGKIGIRDDILLKPSRLSGEEFNLIKEHSALGSKILSSIESLEWVSHVILHHHERYDGTGYPNHICEKDIPIESRIISVVDTFDAITSSRPYRKTPMSIENAKNLLSEMAGSQLCPVCVKAFLAQLTLKDQFNGILANKGGL